MALSPLLDVLAHRVLVADGAMGTMLQTVALSLDDFAGLEGCNEILNVTRPDVVRAVHRGYLEAGADAVESNTFGANLANLAEYDIADRIRELAEAGATLAREVADEFAEPGRPQFVLGSVGPGTKLPTLGHIGFAELRDAYVEQVRGLLAGGADAVLVETSQDLLQCKAAVIASRRAMVAEARHVPIITQVTLETTGTMLLGTEIGAALTALQPLGIDLIGLNCATGPAEMSEHLRQLSKHSRIPLAVMPNAGLPELGTDGAVYPLTPDELAAALAGFVTEFGVRLVGGCCGTTGQHIAAVAQAVAGLQLRSRRPRPEPGVSSLYAAVPFHQDASVLMVGERTNANGSKAFRAAMLAERSDDCVEIARAQTRDGAHLIDLCVDYVGRDGAADMAELAGRLATASTLPVMLDSTEPAVLHSVFLHECVQAGLDTAIVHPSKIVPMARIPDEQRAVALDLVYDRRRSGPKGDEYDPLQELMALFEGVTTSSSRESRAAELAALPLFERLERRIIDGDRNGLAEGLDAALQQRPALQIINDTLLSGMKTVGDLFGSGQMQLPFVLQSAETMKVSVAHLEPHMERSENDTGKGRLVLATVKGDVHDIGKNLVDIILSNNGYEVVNLGIKQPISAILEAATEHHADAIGMSGLLVKSTVIMKGNLEEMNSRGLDSLPVLLGGAALTRAYVENDLAELYAGEVRYAQDAFEGLRLMDSIMTRKRGGTVQADPGEDAKAAERKARRERSLRLAQARRAREDSTEEPTPARSDVAIDVPIPTPPFWGSRVVKGIPAAEVDVLPVHLVTMGQAIADYAAELFAKDAYRDYLEVHGIGVQLTEALAEYWHRRIREELHFASGAAVAEEDPAEVEEYFKLGYRGARYSLGYGACPELEDRAKIVALLRPERIGVTLSEEFQLHPEQSTGAIVAHHPEAKYFNA